MSAFPLTYRTLLCKHGPSGAVCRRYACRFAHSLDELRLLPVGYGDRWSVSLCSYWIGQELIADVLSQIKRYYDLADISRAPIPVWAEACMWYYRGYPLDYMPELGDFGVREAYDAFAMLAYRAELVFKFPKELTERLSVRMEMLSRMASKAAAVPSTTIGQAMTTAAASSRAMPAAAAAVGTAPMVGAITAVMKSPMSPALYEHDKGPVERPPRPSAPMDS